MAQNLIDLLIWQSKQKEKYFQNFRQYAKRIKEIAKEELGEAEVFIFGSILEKQEVPRDIDLLIISPKLTSPDKKTKLKVRIWQKIGVTSPFEIHPITPKEYKNWYRYFIKKKLKI